MSVKLKLLPKKEKLFEPETIECPPNVEGLFRYAETIVKSEIKQNRGQAFVLEMLNYGKDCWLTNQSIANKEIVTNAKPRV